MKAQLATFRRFCLIGALGFAVDAGTLTGLHRLLGMDPITARVFAIALALTVTWACHRHYTFNSSDPRRWAEWCRYAMVNGFGAALNFAVYTALLTAYPALDPLLALAAGSILALFINFTGSQIFAFQRRHRSF